jgi:predicted AlkP superfamily pyrophosphatase or phosphodiesterase
MRKRSFFCAGLLFVLGLTACAPADAGPVEEDVKLVVYVVVDQLRGDLLDRYADVFTGGFARMRREGLHYRNATFDHAQTATAPGHATAATGTHPNRHGLVGNTWDERSAEDGSWRSVYALLDPDSPILGEPGMEGRGPRNVLRTGIADWLVAHDPAARIVSLAGKDRSAIAMAGHVRGEVYWMDGRGRFLTSAYYRDAYPEWLERFHAETLPRMWRDTVWQSTVPDWALPLSRPDTFPHEGDGVNTYFPHRASREAGGTDERALSEWRFLAPYPDRVILALAREAVRELRLGGRGSIDYLALGLSQADRIGHNYGPLSREQLDNLVRLDRELGEFLEFLDEAVGSGRWTLALTADHGALELPEARGDLGLYGRRITPGESSGLVARARAAAEAAGGDPVAAARAAAAAVRSHDWVADAFAWADLLADGPADSMQVLYTRSWHPERTLGSLGRLGVAVRFHEGVLSGRYPTGSSHGSPYFYDRHVPVLLLGPGIPPGPSGERVSVVDVAPTLARLVGVEFPADLDGRPLLERSGAGGSP